MNYTEHYQLPQWEKTDRILMEDFNQMCRNIESGIDSAKQGAGAETTALAQLVESVRQQAAQDDRLLMEGLLRGAYNRCLHLAGEAAVPRQAGYFHQSLKGPSFPAGVTGMVLRDDACWMSRGAAAYTVEDFKATIQVVSSMKVVKDSLAACVPLVLTFTAPGPGRLNQMAFPGTFNNNSGSSGACRMVLTDVTLGKTVVDNTFNLGIQNAPAGTTYIRAALNCYLENKHSYRLEIASTDAGCNADYHYDSSESSAVSMTCFYLPEATVVRTLTTEEEYRGGVVVVHYATAAAGGTLALEWDGATVEPYRTRTVTDSQGRSVQEAEYRRIGTVPTESGLCLRLTCLEDGELTLYDWCAMLI